MIRAHRSHPLWFAYVVHRVSGLALALFLPVHFYTLSLAITRPDTLDSFLRLADDPLFKVAEFGLVFLLAVHVFGGLRLLALEWLPWSGPLKTAAAAAIGVSILVSGTFFLQAI